MNDVERPDADLEQWLRADAQRRYGKPPAAAATWGRLSPRLEQRRRWRQYLHWHPLRLAPLGAALLALLAVAVLLHPTRPAPVSAAEILARASRATDSTNPAGLRAFFGTIANQSRQTHDSYQISTYDPATTPLVQNESSLWFQAPSHWRAESPGGLTVTDGTNCWGTDHARQRTYRINLARCDPAPLFTPSNLSALFDGASNEYEAHLGTDTTIAGRSAYSIVIRLAPVPVPTIKAPPIAVYPSSATGQIVRTVWIDRQTYLLLGMEDRDPRGTLLVGWTFSHLDLNPTLDPTVFIFSPPGDYAIIDQRNLGTPTP